MPFDPIRTDERVAPTRGRRKKSDFEMRLMGGCFVIVVVSFLLWGTLIWPFFAFEMWRLVSLYSWVALAVAPATALGIIATRIFGYQGVSGSIGGFLTGAVFVHLAVDQLMIGKVAVDVPAPEYPESWKYFLPLAMVVWAFAVFSLTLKEPVEPRGVEPSSDR